MGYPSPPSSDSALGFPGVSDGGCFSITTKTEREQRSCVVTGPFEDETNLSWEICENEGADCNSCEQGKEMLRAAIERARANDCMY